MFKHIISPSLIAFFQKTQAIKKINRFILESFAYPQAQGGYYPQGRYYLIHQAVRVANVIFAFQNHWRIDEERTLLLTTIGDMLSSIPEWQLFKSRIHNYSAYILQCNKFLREVSNAGISKIQKSDLGDFQIFRNPIQPVDSSSYNAQIKIWEMIYCLSFSKCSCKEVLAESFKEVAFNAQLWLDYDACSQYFCDTLRNTSKNYTKIELWDALLLQAKERDKNQAPLRYLQILSLTCQPYKMFSIKMLNQGESLVLDERYRPMIEEDVPTGGLIRFEEEIAVLTSQKADIDNLHRVTILLRKYFSISSSRIPYQYEKRLILRLIELSLQQQYRQLRYQALSTLANIAFINSMHMQLIKNGALELFFQFIRQEDISISRLAMRGIGEIAAGYHWTKIGLEGLKRLLEFQKISIDQKTNEVLLGALARLLLYYQNKVKYQAVVGLLPAYHNVPQYVSQVWVGTMWYYFKQDKISALFESGTVPHLLNYLHSQNEKLTYQSLKLITTIIVGGNQYIDRLIDLDLIDHIVRLLEKQSPHRHLIALYCLLCLSRQIVHAKGQSHNLMLSSENCLQCLKNNQMASVLKQKYAAFFIICFLLLTPLDCILFTNNLILFAFFQMKQSRDSFKD